MRLANSDWPIRRSFSGEVIVYKDGDAKFPIAILAMSSADGAPAPVNSAVLRT